MEARRWLEGVTFLADRPLINVSQAAPVDLPPEQMRAAMADIIVNEPQAHLYGPVMGLPELRAEVATQWSATYGASLTADNVAITSGCNQAFAAAISAIAQSGDEVLLPAPWYFNHKMWLDMAGVTARATPTDAQLLPDPEATRALITERTRAISLVTPNNPAGVEYPPELVLAFFKLAQETGIKLIVDETYRDFHSQTGAPHGLFQQADWDQTLIHLYSFLSYDKILARRATIETEMPTLAAKGWTLKGCGAYFAYLEHPFEMASDVLAQKLVEEASILALPGTMFTPENDVAGQQHLRIAFANVDATGIAELFTRLKALRFSLAPPRAGK